MMSIQTLIANRKAIPETIRQAGYPWLAKQTENDLAELCKAQGEELTKCRQALVDAYNERDDAHAALRIIMDESRWPPA